MRRRGGGGQRFTRKHACPQSWTCLPLPLPSGLLIQELVGQFPGSGCGTRPWLRAEGLQLPAPAVVMLPKGSGSQPHPSCSP